MFLKFLQLELKSFVRSPQFAAGILIIIGMLFMYAYLALIFVGGSFGVYFERKSRLRTDSTFQPNFLSLHCHRFAVEIFYAATSCGKHQAISHHENF